MVAIKKPTGVALGSESGKSIRKGNSKESTLVLKYRGDFTRTSKLVPVT